MVGIVGLRGVVLWPVWQVEPEEASQGHRWEVVGVNSGSQIRRKAALSLALDQHSPGQEPSPDSTAGDVDSGASSSRKRIGSATSPLSPPPPAPCASLQTWTSRCRAARAR